MAPVPVASGVAAIKQGCHHPASALGYSFQATGITVFRKLGGSLENAAQMANHASTRPTQLYDRRREELHEGDVKRSIECWNGAPPHGECASNIG
jgi:hypothetical protein